jgi:hypothetical protein
MKAPRCACGEEAVVTMHDVWLCLEDFRARLEQRSRALQQALELVRSARTVKI